MPNWVPFVVSFSTSLALTAGVIWVCNRKRWLVFPREERWSRNAVAKFGGVAILLSLVAGSCTLRLNHQMRVIVLLTAAMAALGLFDDVYELPARWKFGGQVAIAALAVWSGIAIR